VNGPTPAPKWERTISTGLTIALLFVASALFLPSLPGILLGIAAAAWTLRWIQVELRDKEHP
jgi:ABC-type Co2+ transport system permease subunit